jgi:hypothetical protein
MPQQNIIDRRLEQVIMAVLPDLLPTLIIDTDDGGWILFGRYTIYKAKDGMYRVNTVGNMMQSKFFNRLRNAATWVVLYQQNRVSDANRVHELDTIIAGLDVEQQQHRRLKNSRDTSQYLIQLTKLTENVLKQKQFITEIDKYNITAQKSQIKGFENATKRISRK